MRKKLPKPREVVVISKFLWFPVCIKGEIRWLENASLLYEYFRSANGFGFWEPVLWLSDKEAAKIREHGDRFSSMLEAVRYINDN